MVVTLGQQYNIGEKLTVILYTYIFNRHAGTPQKQRKQKGKRHNRVHPGHFATQQGTPFYPAGTSAADWSTLVFTLPRRKMAWVHPTKATFFQNCTLMLDKYPVVSENETLPPAISPAEITLGSKTPGVVTICGWSAAGRRPTSGLQQQLQGSCARVRRIQNARRRNHLRMVRGGAQTHTRSAAAVARILRPSPQDPKRQAS